MFTLQSKLCKKKINKKVKNCACFRERYDVYSDCLRRESNFWTLTHRVTALYVCTSCCSVCVCDCVMVIHITQAYVQIMQHTHTHKAVTGRIEAKKLLSRQRQSKYNSFN